MSGLSVIENKISALLKYLEILERYKKYSIKELQNDIDLRGAVERYLYLAVQAAIDSAEAIVAYKKLRKPATMSENFDILKENNFISDDLCEKMIKMVGFRNIIAHDYGKINYKIVDDVLQNGVKDIKEFIKKAQKNLNLK